jgi:hypothetical protein
MTNCQLLDKLHLSMRAGRSCSLLFLLAVVTGIHGAIVNQYREFRHGGIGGRAQRLAGAHIELGAMQYAFNFRAFEFAGAQFEILVRALVLQGIDGAVDVADQNRRVAVETDRVFARQQLRERAYPLPAREVDGIHGKGFSRISKRRSSRSGMPKRSSPYGNGLSTPVRR